MSRSGYTDDGDQWSCIKWRGAVAAAVRGRRGQAFLREMLNALDAVPTRRLIRGDWENLNGVCALGSVSACRKIDLSDLDPDDESVRYPVADRLGIAPALAAEIMYANDEGAGYWVNETPEDRWARVRRWVEAQITK